MTEAKKVENVIIVGGGPAGYTAALYTARANLEPLVFEGFQWGGQLQNTTDVENYPGYPGGIMGPEMMNEFRAQAERFGTRFVTDDVDRVELSDGGVQKVFLGDEEYQAKAVILAMGAEPQPARHPRRARAQRLRSIDLRRLRRGLLQRPEGDRDRRRRLGDGGLDLHLQVRQRADRGQPPRASSAPRRSCSTGPRSRATSASRPPTWRRSSSPATRAASTTCACATSRPDETEDFQADGAFIAIGHIPRSEVVTGQVDTDENGYILTEGGSTRTNLAGVFAVGDVVDHIYRQAVTAAGSGCKGALDAEWYLRDTPPSPEAHWLPGGEPVEVAPTPGS